MAERLHRDQRQRSASWIPQGITASFDNIVTVAGRLGFTTPNNSLFYGLAGWAFGRANIHEFEGCDAPCDNLDYSGTARADGPTLGVGFEHLFGRNLSARVEYRWTRLTSDAVSGACTPQTTPSCGAGYFGTASASSDIHSIRAALVLRLGGGP